MARPTLSIHDLTARLGVSRQRVHQLLRLRGITPHRVTLGRFTVFMLTEQQARQLERPARPKQPAA